MIRNLIFSKKNVILSSLLDLLFITCFSLANKFNSVDIFCSLIFIILIGYVVGKYHNFYIRKYTSVLKISYKLLINSLIYCIISLFLLEIFSISVFKYKILSLIIICYISQLLINYLIPKIFKRLNNYLVISSKEFFDKLQFLAKDHFILKHLDINYLNNFESSDLDCNSKIICYPQNIKEKKEIKNVKMEYIDFSDYEKFFNWCNEYIYQIPVDFFRNYNLHSLIFKSKRLLIEIRIKRFSDIIFSILLLILTLPLLIISSIFIYLEDRGPIIYKQLRTGKHKKTFSIYKLRTMKVNAETDGAKWSKQNDIRITEIGNFLRRTRIDELPQLINVLKGEMSLIGPRPERPEFDEILSNSIPHYLLRYSVSPGLSGWAQVNYNYTASNEDSKYKLAYDLFYLANFSCLLDLVIFFKTIRAVFNAKGAIAN